MRMAVPPNEARPQRRIPPAIAGEATSAEKTPGRGCNTRKRSDGVEKRKVSEQAIQEELMTTRAPAACTQMQVRAHRGERGTRGRTTGE